MAKKAVFFPGIGYHCDKPLLYYSRDVVRELGYTDQRNVNYTYGGGNVRGDEQKMKEAYEALFLQAEAELAGVDWAAFDDVLFVSKSIGTIIAASYARKHALEQVRHVLYTPLAQTYLFAPKRAIGFIGTADPWSDTEEIIRLSAENHVPLVVCDGGNHSLECGDTLRNLAILREVTCRTMEFCREGKGTAGMTPVAGVERI